MDAGLARRFAPRQLHLWDNNCLLAPLCVANNLASQGAACKPTPWYVPNPGSVWQFMQCTNNAYCSGRRAEPEQPGSANCRALSFSGRLGANHTRRETRLIDLGGIDGDTLRMLPHERIPDTALPREPQRIRFIIPENAMNEQQPNRDAARVQDDETKVVNVKIKSATSEGPKELPTTCQKPSNCKK